MTRAGGRTARIGAERPLGAKESSRVGAAVLARPAAGKASPGRGACARPGARVPKQRERYHGAVVYARITSSADAPRAVRRHKTRRPARTLCTINQKGAFFSLLFSFFLFIFFFFCSIFCSSLRRPFRCVLARRVFAPLRRPRRRLRCVCSVSTARWAVCVCPARVCRSSHKRQKQSDLEFCFFSLFAFSFFFSKTLNLAQRSRRSAVQAAHPPPLIEKTTHECRGGACGRWKSASGGAAARRRAAVGRRRQGARGGGVTW